MGEGGFGRSQVALERRYEVAFSIILTGMAVSLFPVTFRSYPEVHVVVGAVIVLVGTLRLPATSALRGWAALAASGALLFEILEAGTEAWNLMQTTPAAEAWAKGAVIANAAGGGLLLGALFAIFVLLARDSLLLCGDQGAAERIATRFKPVVLLGVVLALSGSVLAVFGVPRLDILTWWHLPFVVPLLAAFVYLLVLVFGSVFTARRALAVRRKPSLVAAWEAREARLI